jgi:hypothetical protein
MCHYIAVTLIDRKKIIETAKGNSFIIHPPLLSRINCVRDSSDILLMAYPQTPY